MKKSFSGFGFNVVHIRVFKSYILVQYQNKILGMDKNGINYDKPKLKVSIFLS